MSRSAVEARTVGSRCVRRMIPQRDTGKRASPRRAASMAATSIFFILLMASKARRASSPPADMAFVSVRAMICQHTPQRSWQAAFERTPDYRRWRRGNDRSFPGCRSRSGTKRRPSGGMPTHRAARDREYRKRSLDHPAAAQPPPRRLARCRKCRRRPGNAGGEQMQTAKEYRRSTNAGVQSMPALNE